jgi:hypothetical protein
MKSLSMLMVAAAVLWISAPVFAANSGQVDVPFSVQLVNPCNGELVDTSGSVHVDETLTITGQTAHMTIHANPQGVTGGGETTGVTYHGTGVAALSQQVSLVNGSANGTFVSRFDFVGQGSVPNFFSDEVMHITANADGTVTASFDVLDTTCH